MLAWYNKNVDYPTLTFKTPEEWEEWLDKNHTEVNGVWLRFFKKSFLQQPENKSLTSLTHNTALNVALCFGWIDSQAKGFDDNSYLQKFTPRRGKSIWSKVNTEHIKRLIKEGKMRPAGMIQVEEAKKDGRWDSAYNSPKDSKVPEDFMKELAKDKKALEFFSTLNRTNVYAITWRLETAKKSETRLKRMTTILQMLAKEETFH